MQGLVAYDKCGYWVTGGFSGNLVSSSVAKNVTSVVSFPGCEKFSTFEKEGKFFSSVAVVQSRIKNSFARAAVFLEKGEVVPENPLLSADERTLNTVEELTISEGTPTVRVKFVLQKECHFGERFDVVGSDPVLGNWDPKAGIRMEWSEGHNWIVEMDVPDGKNFEFKFVHIGVDGEIEWQPGSNHHLDTTESISPLVVSLPWALEEAESEEEKVVPIGEQDTEITVTAEAATTAFTLGMDTLSLEGDQLGNAEISEPESHSDDVHGKLPCSHSSVSPSGSDSVPVPTLATTLVEVSDGGIADGP
eukprot:c26438_g2_i1 orf=458-1372(+)